MSREYRSEPARCLLCVAGSVLYAAGLNLFVVSNGLYCGALLGYCQLLRTVLVERFGLHASFDYASLIYYLINVPILIVGLKELDLRFVLRTLLTISAMAAAFSLIPVKALLPEDPLTGSIIGGIVSGVANGMILRASSTAGGFDIIGMIIVKRNRNASMGRITIALSALFFLICLFMFPVEIVVYSVIYLAIYSVVLDMLHTQNIEVEVKIVTHCAGDMEQCILKELQRGVTRWSSVGSYTKQESHVLCVIVSKYELAQLSGIVKKYDPNAFMIVSSNVHVIGNFVKRV